MDANKIWILRDFVGANKVLFKIPVYQRNYDWSESNCTRLLSDIKKVIDTGDKHFLGAIVFMADKSGGFSFQEYVIIDGQQRLTTTMLLLKALADVSEGVDDDCKLDIEEDYLFNKRSSEEFKVKLKPIKSDNNQFQLLLKNKLNEMDEDTHIYKNYIACKDCFQSWIDAGIAPQKILVAMTKLEIVEIVLTKGEDDPQIIFESINSTGLELTNSDLIRNFLLMNAENQEELYENYWLPIEQSLKNKSDYTNLDFFFMTYITYKVNSPITSKYLYEKFVKLFDDFGYTQESVLKELKYFANIFKAFVYGNPYYSIAINKNLEKIRLLNQTTCYPFLLHIFNDYNNKIISENTLVKILSFLVSYLLRRIVCGVPSNSLKSLFIYLYNRVFKVENNKQKYYESINKFFSTISSKDTVPSNADFEVKLCSSNIYGNSALCKFLLSDIENGESKETVDVSTLTIEHIMPQTLSSDWRHITDAEHEKWLHSLGNLSVTGYNSELYNKSFDEKKKIIIENSKAVVLNKDILNKDSWGVKEIESRAKKLSEIITKRYNIEKIIDNNIEFEYITTITLSDYSEVKGKKLVSFVFEKDTYRQNRYALMLLDIIKILMKKDKEKMQILANNNFSFNVTNKKHAHINTDGINMRWPWKVTDSVFIEANLSAWSCIRFIEALLGEYNIDKSNFKFNVIAEEDDEEKTL